MRDPSRPTLPAAAVVAAGLAGWIPALAQQDPNQRWKDTAEFSYVATAGNAQTNTLGFKNKLWRDWARSSFEVSAGGIRAESKTTAIFALGTTNDFDVKEETSEDLTAENYYLNGRYSHKFTDRFFWFVGAGWDRNRFAGVDNRYTGSGGVGNIWADKETNKFRTDYSVSFTKQDDVVSSREFDDTFLGARISSSYLHKFGAATTYTNDTILDENLDETDDFRANMINSVAVAINARLALKVSLQWLYDHEPSFQEVDLFDPLAPPPGGSPIDTVLVELDELDTIFTTSLVVNF